MSKLAPLGSLLDLINVTNKDKTIAEPLALHLTAEVFQTFCWCLVRQCHLFSDFGTCASIALDGPDPRRLEAGQLPGHRPSRHESSILILGSIFQLLKKTSFQAFTIGLCR